MRNAIKALGTSIMIIYHFRIKMTCLCVVLLALTVAITTAHSVSKAGASSHRVYSQERQRRDQGLSASHTNSSSNTSCPTWFYLNPNRTGPYDECICIDGMQSMIHCDNKSQKVYLGRDYCMTYIEEQDEFYVGSCPYSYHHMYTRGLSVELPPERSKLNDFMCGSLNREGLLCGACKKGYGVSPYSIQRICTLCSGTTGWGWYILIDFTCQTIFFIVLLVTRISVTSPALSAYVLYAQIVSTVNVNALFSLVRNTPDLNNLEGFTTFSFILLNVWKLEFFTSVVPPQCLFENLSTLGGMAVKYISAFYPLLLILLLCLCIRIRDCKWRPVVTVWRPFQKTRTKLKQYYKLDQPATKAFATIFLLSYVRIADVSYSLLLPTQLYNSRGEHQPRPAWFYNAGVDLFGAEHAVCGVFAIIVLLTYILIPPLLLFFYPFKFFQKLLGKIRYGRNSLKIFMDIMQSHYKDGLNGTSDLRSFSAVYFFVRLIFIAIRLLSVYHGWHYSVLSLLFIGCGLLVLLLRPYKKNIFNYIDCFFLSTLALEFHMYFLVVVYSALTQTLMSSLLKLFFILGLSPIFYFLAYLLYHLFVSIKFPEKIKNAVNEKWTKVKSVAAPVTSRRYSIMADLENSIDMELPDRCVRPELYDSFLMSTHKKFTDGPATI